MEIKEVGGVCVCFTIRVINMLQSCYFADLEEFLDYIHTDTKYKSVFYGVELIETSVFRNQFAPCVLVSTCFLVLVTLDLTLSSPF